MQITMMAVSTTYYHYGDLCWVNFAPSSLLKEGRVSAESWKGYLHLSENRTISFNSTDLHVSDIFFFFFLHDS